MSGFSSTAKPTLRTPLLLTADHELKEALKQIDSYLGVGRTAQSEKGSNVQFRINTAARTLEAHIGGDWTVIGQANEAQGVTTGVANLFSDQNLMTITRPLNLTSTLTVAGDITASGLTASRLVATSAGKVLTSTGLHSWVTGITNQVSVANDGDGTITLSTPQDIHTGASPTFAGLTLGSLDGLLKAATGVVGTATVGTSLSYSAGTLNTIQGIRTADSPTFAGLTVGSLGGILAATAGVLGVVTPQAHIADPSGVTTDEDVETRTAIGAIFDLLEALGLMGGAP